MQIRNIPIFRHLGAYFKGIVRPRYENYPCKFDQTYQRAIVYRPDTKDFRPLVVCLHAWSHHYDDMYGEYLELARKMGWNMIHPDFRGPNWMPVACGSDAVVSDIIDAVMYMKATANIDAKRIYLIGGSGGGHCSLLMAGRYPEIWAGVSSWCPISSIAQWYRECKDSSCNSRYADNIEMVCGGAPDKSQRAMQEALFRSPLTWLSNARNVSIDIATGIHDGHGKFSVPVSHAINAYNILANENEHITEEDIDTITTKEHIPEKLRFHDEDPAYGKKSVLFRCQSNHVRLTIFDGGHAIIPEAGFYWLEHQNLGGKPDWRVVRTQKRSTIIELPK